ncbi:MAG: PlsC domain-containing protein [Burkholderia sp.]|jgi:1-acyl-sn-glycerol-3-phosphate acyltransferase
MNINATLRGWVFYFLLAVSIIVLAVCVLITAPFTGATWRYEALCRPWAQICLRMLRAVCGVKVSVEGRENLPKPGTPIVVLSKHQSAYDPFWLAAEMPAPLCFLYKRSINWIPFFGWVAMAMKQIPVDRSHGRSSFLSFMEHGPDRLRDGWWICLFPEGTRTLPGEAVHYKSGGARFASRTGTDILPVCIAAAHCWPKNSIAKYPGTVRVSIGPVISAKGKDYKVLNTEVQSWIENELKRIS